MAFESVEVELEFSPIATRVRRSSFLFQIQWDEYGVFEDSLYAFGPNGECSLKVECPAEFTLQFRFRAVKDPDLLSLKVAILDVDRVKRWERSFEDVPESFFGVREITADVLSPYNTLASFRDGKAFLYVELDMLHEDEDFSDNATVCV